MKQDVACARRSDGEIACASVSRRDPETSNVYASRCAQSFLFQFSFHLPPSPGATLFGVDRRRVERERLVRAHRLWGSAGFKHARAQLRVLHNLEGAYAVIVMECGWNGMGRNVVCTLREARRSRHQQTRFAVEIIRKDCVAVGTLTRFGIAPR